MLSFIWFQGFIRYSLLWRRAFPWPIKLIFFINYNYRVAIEVTIFMLRELRALLTGNLFHKLTNSIT